jgi:hypothetical protein
MKPFIVRLGTLAATGMLAGGLAVAASGTALAASNPSPTGTGQPSRSCQDQLLAQGSEPGNAGTAPGSAFNEPPPFGTGGTAGNVYAGNQPQSQVNPNSVSQYDVACYQVSQPH